MSYKVIPTSTFKKEAKRLIKKFPSLKNELLDLSKSLAESPETGTPLGNNTFKIRVAIQSKGKGKSGVARVVTYVVTADEEVYLLTIYDKSDLANVDDKTLKTIIKKLASD